MLQVVRHAVLLAVLVGPAVGAAQQATPVPTPTPEQRAVALSFGVARSDEARVAVFKVHPWLQERVGVTAIIQQADVFARQRDAEMAERMYRSLEWLGEFVDSDRIRISALAGLGNVEGQLRGNLTRSLALSEQALALADRVGDRLASSAPLSNLGILHRRFGDFDRAAEYFARAMSVAEAEGQLPTISRVLNNIGTLHYYRGNLSLAREYFERSLAMKRAALQATRTAEATLDLANTLTNVGILYLDIGDARQALEHLEQSKALYGDGASPRTSMFVLASIGRAHLSLGDLDAAGQAIEQTARFANADGDKVMVAQALFLRGLLSRDRGELLEAMAFQQESLALRNEIGDVAALADSHAEISRLLLLSARPAEAEAEARKALAIADPARLPAQQVAAQFHLAQALEARGLTAQAAESYAEAIARVEDMRERALGEDRARQVFMRERLGPYTALAALHARSGRAWEALLTIEQARARSLLDVVSHGRPQTTILSDALRRREREVINQLASSRQQLNIAERDRTLAPEVLAARQEDHARARAAYDAFERDVTDAHPRLRLTRGDTPLVTAESLQALVPVGTAAVQFVVDAQDVWVYLVEGRADTPAVSVHRLSITPAALLRKADRVSRQIAARDLGFGAASRDLYADLFAGIDGALQSTRRVIVVPDATLWNVPFQALMTPRGRYLIEERAVSYAPSLSALAALRVRADRRAEQADRAMTLLALGDPTDAGVPAADRRGTTGPLPEARREVTALGRLYGADRSTILVGPEATEAAWRAAAGSARVLHIASHGVLDDHGPMYSHLRLAPGRGDDGRLEAWEIADMELSSDLVVLSACETARGTVGGGEGVIGLSWALLAAGASAAVLSQWEVDSAGTTALMIAFHERRLRSAGGPDATPDALRHAALQLLKDPRYRHPFYWAGFVVIGS